MATIREALRNRLTRDAAVAALIGSRVAPIRTKQRDAYPQVTYSRTGGSEWGHLGGRSGVSEITFRLDCWSAASELEAAALATAVKAAWDRYKGGESGVFIQYAKATDLSDNPADPNAGDDVGLYCEAVDLTIVYEG